MFSIYIYSNVKYLIFKFFYKFSNINPLPFRFFYDFPENFSFYRNTQSLRYIISTSLYFQTILNNIIIHFFEFSDTNQNRKYSRVNSDVCAHDPRLNTYADVMACFMTSHQIETVNIVRTCNKYYICTIRQAISDEQDHGVRPGVFVIELGTLSGCRQSRRKCDDASPSWSRCSFDDYFGKCCLRVYHVWSLLCEFRVCVLIMWVFLGLPTGAFRTVVMEIVIAFTCYCVFSFESEKGCYFIWCIFVFFLR